MKSVNCQCTDCREVFKISGQTNVLCVYSVTLNYVYRFLLSLSSCQRCLVVDDQLTVLPISSHVLELTPVSREDVTSETGKELDALKESLRDTQPVSALLNCCRTLDQVIHLCHLHLPIVFC